MTTKTLPIVNCQFMKRSIIFPNKAAFEKAVKAAVKVDAPRSAEYLKHQIILPKTLGLPPVSYVWFASHILQCPPTGISEKSGIIRGMYNPLQVLTVCQRHFGAVGVKVVSSAQSATYLPFQAEGKTPSGRKVYNPLTNVTKAAKRAEAAHEKLAASNVKADKRTRK